MSVDARAFWCELRTWLSLQVASSPPSSRDICHRVYISMAAYDSMVAHSTSSLARSLEPCSTRRWVGAMLKSSIN